MGSFFCKNKVKHFNNISFNNKIVKYNIRYLYNLYNTNKILFFKHYISTYHNIDILSHIGYNKNSYVYISKYKYHKKKYILKIIINDNDDYNNELFVLKNNKSNNLVKLIDYFNIDITIDNIIDKYFVLIIEKCKFDLEHIDLIKFSYNQKINLCLDILNGLKELYNRGYYHGDIKPENIGIKYIKINKNYIVPRLCLLDFGLTFKYNSNNHELANTYPYISIIQLYNQIVSNHIKFYNNNQLSRLKNIILQLCDRSYIIDKNIYFYEDKIDNQLFTFGLICCYIFSNNLCFFDYQETNNHLIIYNNIIKFYNNKKKYIKLFLKKIRKYNNFNNRFYQWRNILIKIFYNKIQFIHLYDYLIKHLYLLPKY